MVSFFGLRFGSDKKKSQSKQSNKKQVAQQPQTQRWNGNGNDSFKFPPPQPQSSRPGTSTSNARNLGWRATFKGVPAASSMVDLSVPRKASESSLRHGIDGAGFKPWMKPNASMTNLAVPDPFGVNGSGRPGMPSRPAGSRQSEWVNPLDVHFNKKSGSISKSSNRAGSGGVKAVTSKSPLSKPDSKAEPEPEPEPAKRDSGGLDDFGEPGPDVGIRGSGYAGYPSPPQSVETEDQWPPMAFAGGDTGAETDIEAEVEVEAEAEGEVEVSTKELQPNQFTAPGFANGPGPTMLPSPSSSTSRKSEDKRASPVVRNVQAKRDTLTFLSPRRRSFTMAIEADDLEKHRQQQRPVEGLTGNFSNFDFGDGVTKQPTVAIGTLGLELVESPIQMKGPHPFREVARADEGDVEEAMDTQDAVGAEDAEDVASDGLTEPSETVSLVSPIVSPIGSPMASPMASPRPSPKQYRAYHQAQDSVEQNSPQRLKVAIPDEDSQSLSTHQPLPSPSAVSAGIESPRQIIRRPSQANIEAPVALGSVLNSFTPSTPQGFNTRMTSDSRSRGPPQPLQHTALSSLIARMETPTQSPRSPYGPAAADEDTYVRTYEAPRPPMDRVPLSPFAARTPMEGEFPVMKGLPRGRQPPRPQMPPSDSPERQSEERSPRPFSKWGGFGFDRSEFRGATVPMPRTPKSQRPSSPTWSLSTPTSDVAPRIPSPTFPSLEKAISATSEDLAKSFEISFDAPQPSPLANEFTINDGPSPSPSIKPSPVIRVEAKKAPPRPTPSPINLPPSLIRDKGPLTPNSLYSPSGSTFI
ncbi:uncharacterized protein Triagg1_5365 [Trichoderma aggressivum f. europaeum]|uniref:Uncharacterized protein n=1 Tax=Trichoderma aggressivum f. europaeum TaxID=173218 RepID=A0AAE1M0L7_9HYPO|nr:hypothetical protein Triagg1_5365 [Trichoderma aggressivum f. europaeum]